MQMLFQAEWGTNPRPSPRHFLEGGDPVEPEVQGFAEDLFRVAPPSKSKSTI